MQKKLEKMQKKLEKKDLTHLPVLVVTRHLALVEYLIETGIISKQQAETSIKEHVTAEDVAGKWVIGVLPPHLQTGVAIFTNLPMFIPTELRGVELNLEQVRQYAQPAVHYLPLVAVEIV